MIRVLLVEDDRAIARVISFYLRESGEYDLVQAADAEEALEMLKTDSSMDIILLDIMLPKMDGMALCSRIRQMIYCPIIFISCLDDEDTIVHALEIGGDDYLTKPFTCKVLCARIKANLRRIQREQHPIQEYVFPDFTLSVASHEVIRQGLATPLAPLEFGILLFLIQHAEQPVTLNQIYEAVWEQPSFGDVRTVVVHLYNIRKKIEPGTGEARYIKNVHGAGYIFDPNGREEAKK